MLEPPRAKPAHPISSVENALRLLVILRDREEIRVSEASAELGVARSTAHRLLAMLHSYGLVEQGTNRAYRVGPVLAEIGLSALRQVDVRAHIRPFLEQLVAELGETAHLIVREGITARFAELDEDELCDLYPDELLPGHFHTRAALFEELDEIRRLGYARNRGESEAGIAAVGLVQRSSSGRIVGAL